MNKIPNGMTDAGNGMALGKSMIDKVGAELSADISVALNKKVDRLKPPRVIGDPTRTPVNKQAAMLLSKIFIYG